MANPTEHRNQPPSREAVADATSELNNLLQIISRASAVIETGGLSEEESKEHLGMLRASINRAEKVAAQLAIGAGGTERKLLLQPEVAPFAKAHKASTVPAVVRQSILLVDDEPMALTLVERILAEAGYQVVTAQSGFECLDIFRRNPHRFAMALLDLSLPFMDGEETFARLRDIRSDLPVILCTGFIQQERLDRMMASGLTGFLRKPIAPDEILNVVGSTLESARYTHGILKVGGVSAAG